MQIVSFTTDFGLSDFYVASLKGSILKRSSDVQIIDVSHQIKPFDIVQAAFYLFNVYEDFPRGTIHVAIVQNKGEKLSDLIIVEHDGHFFIGPNNGLFSLIFSTLNANQVYNLKPLEDQSTRFNDLISHAIACIKNELSLPDFCIPCENFESKIGFQAVTTNDNIRATIIHCDHFGNLIVNLQKDKFEQYRKGRNYRLFYKSKDPIVTISEHYSKVQLGEVMAFFNGSDFLEIAINMGNASKMLGLEKNDTIQIDFY